MFRLPTPTGSGGIRRDTRPSRNGHIGNNHAKLEMLHFRAFSAKSMIAAYKLVSPTEFYTAPRNGHG
jgi:hypothetical protein